MRQISSPWKRQWRSTIENFHCNIYKANNINESWIISQVGWTFNYSSKAFTYRNMLLLWIQYLWHIFYNNRLYRTHFKFQLDLFLSSKVILDIILMNEKLYLIFIFRIMWKEKHTFWKWLNLQIWAFSEQH